jgi:hypothetical protein
MMKLNTIEDLQSLIDNEIEESTELEYKSSFAIENKKWKEELAKDVSAMANANGGTIIYGIRQKADENGHAIPNELLPVPYTAMTKDKLSQLLSSNIQPLVDDVEITVIPKDKESGFFVVQIPQSNTVHQNKLTHLYYKRRNATIEVMEDYEIRDVMNRGKHPVIELEFELHKTIKNITKKPLVISQLLNPQQDDEIRTEIEYKLKYRLVNKGKVYAKYINCFIHIPLVLNPDKESEPDEVDRMTHSFVISDDNTVRDVTGFNNMNREYGPARYDPLLPGVTGRNHSCKLCFADVDDISTVPPIWYSVMADNAPERKVVVEWKDIKTITKTKEIVEDPNSWAFNPILNR